MKIKKSYFSLTKNGGAYLLGLFATQNVIYIFKVGNTNINIEWIIGFVIFLLLLICRKKDVVFSLKNTPKEIRIYFLAIILSFIPAILYLVLSTNNYLSSFLNGLIALFLSYCVFIDCVSLAKYKESILKGLYHGLLLNVLFSLIQFLVFRSGSYLSLYSLFPQQAFYVSIPWSVSSQLEANRDFLIYSYRAMGFFLECSYFVAHMTCVVLVMLSYGKNNMLLKAAVGIMTVLIAMSGSGNFVIYLLAFLIYYLFSKQRKNKRNTKSSVAFGMLSAIVLIPLCVVLIQKLNIQDVVNGIVESINGANIKDVSNTTRLTFMLSAINLYLDYPLGVGYNIGSKALLSYSGAHASFNFLINTLLEIGPLGLAAYVFMMSKNSILHLKHKNCIVKNLGIAVLIMWFYQFANGTGFTSIIWVLFALIIIEKNSKSDEVINNGKFKNTL